MLLVEWLNFILNICAFDEGLQRLKIDEEARETREEFYFFDREI